MEKNTTDYMVKVLEELLNIPSPSGFTKAATEWVRALVTELGFESEYLAKGGLLVKVPGRNPELTIGVSAHLDTLGAMVRSINSNGTLRFIPVGGIPMQTLESEHCRIHTRSGKVYTGTFLCNSMTVHVYDDARTLERVPKNMHIRIDERVKTKEDVQALGINTGDYISYGPDFMFTESGFIKSRFLDDKASVAILLTMLAQMKEEGKQPEYNLNLLVTNMEEVGFGCNYIPSEIREFIAVDMGAIGDDLNGNEYSVSICACDGGGPYDYEITGRLQEAAKAAGVEYVVDVFSNYSSDATTAMRGGNNVRIGLLGPGIHASHGMERTHISAMEGTLKTLQQYLQIA
ncbi:MAG: M42 family metallopeptidase [Lachnospiraceae bacterium]|nr:M42 family metallopeptidase [Lachnospiraceae bacterium]